MRVTENRGRFFRVELLFAKENQGTCKNYNQAMKRSNGEYIKLVDGDDILLPECIEMLVNECDKKKSLMQGEFTVIQAALKAGALTNVVNMALLL